MSVLRSSSCLMSVGFVFPEGILVDLTTGVLNANGLRCSGVDETGD